MIEAGILCSSFKEEIDSLEGRMLSPSKGTTAAVRECTCSDLPKSIIISLLQYADFHFSNQIPKYDQKLLRP